MIFNKLISDIKKIEVKFAYLFLTLFFKTIINIFLIFYVAKVVNVYEFGSFTLSFVVMTIAILLIDYGYNLHTLVLNYDNRVEILRSISSIISGKIFISIILILFSIPILYFSSLDYNSKAVIIILSISAIPNSFGNLYFSLFKAGNNYKIETIGYLLQGLLLIFLLILNHFFGKVDIITISIAILITKLSYFIYAYLKFRIEFPVQFKLSFKKAIKSYLESFSYGTQVILGTLILYIDTLFLSYFTDMEVVGYYQSAMRLIMAASLFGAIITDGFVPEIARKLQNRLFVKNKMTNLFNFLFVFYFLSIITLAFYFKSIINILFSNDFQLIETYLPYILSIIILRAIGIVPGVILTSFGFQKIRAKAVAYSCVLSIIFNLILVPLYGLEGAFISFLSANILLNLVYFFYAIKEVYFIKVIVPNVTIVLFIYLIMQYLWSTDNILCLSISIIINLLIQIFTQKSIKKRSINVIN